MPVPEFVTITFSENTNSKSSTQDKNEGKDSTKQCSTIPALAAESTVSSSSQHTSNRMDLFFDHASGYDSTRTPPRQPIRFLSSTLNDDSDEEDDEDSIALLSLSSARAGDGSHQYADHYPSSCLLHQHTSSLTNSCSRWSSSDNLLASSDALVVAVADLPPRGCTRP